MLTIGTQSDTHCHYIRNSFLCGLPRQSPFSVLLTSTGSIYRVAMATAGAFYLSIDPLFLTVQSPDPPEARNQNGDVTLAPNVTSQLFFHQARIDPPERKNLFDSRLPFQMSLANIKHRKLINIHQKKKTKQNDILISRQTFDKGELKTGSLCDAVVSRCITQISLAS